MRGKDMGDRKLSKREKFLEQTLFKTVAGAIIAFMVSIAMPDWNRMDCMVCFFALWFVLVNILGDVFRLFEFIRRRYL